MLLMLLLLLLLLLRGRSAMAAAGAAAAGWVTLLGLVLWALPPLVLCDTMRKRSAMKNLMSRRS